MMIVALTTTALLIPKKRYGLFRHLHRFHNRDHWNASGYVSKVLIISGLTGPSCVSRRTKAWKLGNSCIS